MSLHFCNTVWFTWLVELYYFTLSLNPDISEVFCYDLKQLCFTQIFKHEKHGGAFKTGVLLHLFAFFFWLRWRGRLVCPFCMHSDWFPLSSLGHESYITFCHLENEAAFTCSADHTIRKWDVVTGQCLAIYRGHTSIVNRWGSPLVFLSSAITHFIISLQLLITALIKGAV